MRIISADERASQKRGAKILLAGRPKIGKTFQLHYLDPDKTLFLDMEAGDLSVQDVKVDAIQPKTWKECRDIALMLAGPNPNLDASSIYSEAHHAAVMREWVADGNPEDFFDKYDTIFVDSITVAGRLCFRWAQQQPEAFNQHGKPDTRSAYGLHGREMISWLTQLQHAREKNVIFACILQEEKDERGRVSWELQIEGSKTGRELPGIVDEIITVDFVEFGEGTDEDPAVAVRTFVCLPDNPHGFPAGDRSGRLEMYEKPHLGDLIDKIVNRPEPEKKPARKTKTKAVIAEEETAENIPF